MNRINRALSIAALTSLMVLVPAIAINIHNGIENSDTASHLLANAQEISKAHIAHKSKTGSSVIDPDWLLLGLSDSHKELGDSLKALYESKALTSIPVSFVGSQYRISSGGKLGLPGSPRETYVYVYSLDENGKTFSNEQKITNVICNEINTQALFDGAGCTKTEKRGNVFFYRVI